MWGENIVENCSYQSNLDTNNTFRIISYHGGIDFNIMEVLILISF